MKIESIVFNDTAEMTVRHPVTGDELIGKDEKPMTVSVFGVQSKHYRSAKNMLMNATSSNRQKKVTAETLDKGGAELLAQCTVSFNHVDGIDFGCGPLEASRAKDIYLATPWFRDQVDEFMADNASFLVKSKTR